MQDTKSMEAEITKFWEKNRIFEKSVSQRPESKQYIFYDGPPFATGLPHYGHILGLTSKDLFPRFWTMKGFRVERRWGWDCHGLPIENIAEKELGIKEKKGIEEHGVAKFNEFCRSKVLFFADEWKKTVVRMGKWIEFDNSYKTMDNTYMESVWYVFKKLYDAGYIYEGKKVLLYCPRCQTPLANAEIAMDNSYKDVTEKSAVAKFKLKKEKDTFLLAWTTTPWTLIGNVALAINPELVYLKIKVGKENLILAKSRLQEVKEKYSVVEEFPGKKLLDMEYEPLYHVPSDKKGHYVINGGSEVLAEEGTGIVHMALYGEFDYMMVRKYDLPIIQHIGLNGKIVSGPKEWIGLWFKKADSEVLKDLEKRNLLFKAEDYKHSYPFCYRCETPLFYNAVNSWFVDIQKVKKKLLEKNKDINWHPENIRDGSFKYILENAPDWSVSRNRFWATSIPVWKCSNEKCKNIAVVGSIKELQELAVEKVPSDVDLHKHIVDNIHLKCQKCKGKMTRIPEVLDCWFESGSMPYGAKHYPFENKEWFKKNFPCDFVSEYLPQVRAWFYYMHVLSVLLFDKAAFRNVVVTGNILAEDGTKMSKSKKNFPDPNLIFEKYGADALRFYLMSSTLMKAQDLNFSENGVKEVYRQITMLLTNIKSFYELFGKDNQNVSKSNSKHILDRWIRSRLHLLIRNVTNSLEDYDTAKACAEIIPFIDELSTWYVRRSRDRFKSQDKKEKTEAIETLAYVLHNLSRLIAPITPFISEHIHQSFRNSKAKVADSVHLESWPALEETLIDETLNKNMKLTREAVSLALLEREKAKVPVRQVLGKLEISGIDLPSDYLELIKDEVNVKKVELKKGKELSVSLDTKITPELLQEGISREIIRNINEFRKELNLTINDRIALYFETDSNLLKESFKKFEKEIRHAVQADELKTKIDSGIKSKEMLANKEKIRIGIKII